MCKVLVAARSADRETLLEALQDLGVLHLIPINETFADEEDSVATKIELFERAIALNALRHAEGDPGDISLAEGAAEIVETNRRQTELNARLSALHREIEQLEPWGELRFGQIEQLRKAGVELAFFEAPQNSLNEFAGEYVTALETREPDRALIALARPAADFELPQGAVAIAVPERDRPTVRAEASDIDQQLAVDATRLAALATLSSEMGEQLLLLKERAERLRARFGSYTDDSLYGVQGWVPEPKARVLEASLADRGLAVAIELRDPEPGEQPPTKIRYPAWARPICGLFDILGTLPGYDETDLSVFFMVALPVFAAMLIGDGGYGLLFALVPLVFWREMVRVMGRQTSQLVVIFGILTVFWGAITGNWFGVAPEQIAANPGPLRLIGEFLLPLRVFPADAEAARNVVIQTSFILGSVHLVLARFRAAIAHWPRQRTFAEFGWCVVLAAMLGVIWQLFFADASPAWLATASMVGIGIGWFPVILFGAPDRNPFKRIVFGLMSSLLPMIGSFGDTMSYIRLMAVGMASYYIAFAFNQLGGTVVAAGSWAWPLAALVVVFGHLLNICLCLIAIFAHGVRLNMLEFSNNAGVQWTGYPYAPLARRKVKED